MKILTLFDADGTLLDTMDSHSLLATACIVKHFSETGITYEQALEGYRRTVGISFSHQLEKLFPGEGYAQKRSLCTEEYKTRKTQEVYEKAPVFPDVPDCLRLLRERGALSLVSTGTERGLIQGILDREGILRYFESVQGLEDGFKRDHIEKARKSYGPDKMFFIGDTAHDVGLHTYGVITIGRHSGMYSIEELLAAGASHVTADFRELPHFLFE